MIQQELIDNFLEMNKRNFPSRVYNLKVFFDTLSYEKFTEINFHDFRDPDNYLMYSILGGWCGLDRFIQGDYILGVLKLLTGGGFGLWWLVDAVTIRNRIKEQNLVELYELLGFI